MAIPDDVAQYAEGKRIVSYFSLGEVQDEDQKKHNWLWTTIGEGVYPYDFDSFRVFIWSLRRHRYETAYIDRNLHGYAPVLLKDVELSATKGSSGAAAAKYPGFSICVEKKDGQRYRREYAFVTNVVRFAGEQPCDAAPPEDGGGAGSLAGCGARGTAHRRLHEAFPQAGADPHAGMVWRVSGTLRRPIKCVIYGFKSDNWIQLKTAALSSSDGQS